MDKVRFSCPRCNTVMQAAADRVGGEVGCPQCQHRFVLVENESPDQPTRDFGGSAAEAPTMPPSDTFRSGDVRSAPVRQAIFIDGNAVVLLTGRGCNATNQICLPLLPDDSTSDLEVRSLPDRLDRIRGSAGNNLLWMFHRVVHSRPIPSLLTMQGSPGLIDQATISSGFCR